MNYIVKFAILDPNAIYNNTWPRVDLIKKEDEESEWFTRLEKSIKQEGILNPINTFTKYRTGELRVLIGGSRLYIAQKLDILIPCIISDQKNFFPNARQLKSKDEIISCFKDPPRHIKYLNEYVVINS